MLRLEKLADWWDKQKKLSEEELNRFVSDNPGLFAVVVAISTQTAMELGAGFVDALRLGEGVKEGGWGYGKDAIRLLTLAGPVAKVGRLVGARIFVDPNIAASTCTWIAGLQALRQTGVSHAVRLKDLLKAANIKIPAVRFNTPAFITDIVPYLESLGARATVLKAPATWNEIVAAAKRGGSLMFSVQWGKVGHTLVGFRDALGRFKILDRTGRIVSNLNELETLYPGIGKAIPWPSAKMVFIKDAIPLSSLAQTGNALDNKIQTDTDFTEIFEHLVLEAHSIILATEAEVNKMMEGYRKK